MAVVLAAGFVLIVAELGRRVMAPEAETAYAAALDLPPGADVIGTALGDRRLALRVRLADGAERLYLLDASDGSLVGTVELGPRAPDAPAGEGS